MKLMVRSGDLVQAQAAGASPMMHRAVVLHMHPSHFQATIAGF